VIRLGPITILRTSTIHAYRTLATATWGLHQVVWFAQDPMKAWPQVIAADQLVADALSRVPREVVAVTPESCDTWTSRFDAWLDRVFP
jgi:hypothetical protein